MVGGEAASTMGSCGWLAAAGAVAVGADALATTRAKASGSCGWTALVFMSGLGSGCVTFP